MTAILRAESRQRIRGPILLTAVLWIFTVFYFSIFPGFADDADELVEGFPDYIFDLFGLDALHTIEGFIAAELYSFFWSLLVAIYFAYIGAGLIAGDIGSRKLDLTLSNPVSRESVLLQKVASLWVPLLILNVGVAVPVYLGSVIIGEPISPVALAMVHLLSVPYHLVCAAIGVLLSVVLAHVRTARSAAFGLVILLWLVDAFSRLQADFEWIGAFTPSRYWEETDILVHEEYAFLDAGILLVAFIVLIGVALFVFIRRDI